MIFCRAQTSFWNDRAFPSQCIGCAYKQARNTTYCKVQNYAELRDQERYALACAYYLYTNDLIDIQPVDDLMEYVRRCCPIAYTQVGKVVSSYGGIRYPPGLALSFPIWNKAKQLTWDRAYDEEGNLCFIAYYDAGNAAYAGFLKTLLTPQERVELFRGSENPLEELLGDVFEIILGMLTFALRFPELFTRWGGPDTINACINGLESCYSRYAAKDSLMLLISGYPRKRKPAKADPDIEQQVQEILHALPESHITAVPTSAELQPPSGVTNAEERTSDDNLFDTTQGVEVPRLIPDEVMEPSGQPDEEDQIHEPRSSKDVANIVKAKAWDSLGLLFNGEIWVDENTVGKICILCGSPHHVFAACKVVNPLRQQITDVFEHVREAITVHPDTIVFQPGTAPAPQPPSGERASGSNDPMEVESVASSGRRPKPKARPKQNVHRQAGDVFIVSYGHAKDLSKEVRRRRGDYNNVCGEDISEIGPASHNELLKCIQRSTCPRDHKFPQRGDRPLYQYNDSGVFENPAYVNIAEGVYGGILEKLPPEGVQFCHPAWDNVLRARHPREYEAKAQDDAKKALRCLQKDLRHHIGRKDKSISLDKWGQDPITTIKCDEGGWVSIEWLLSFDLLWCHHNRHLAYSLPNDYRNNYRNREAEMQRRLQLLIDGNYFNLCGGDGKLRLQFLGVRFHTPETLPPDFNAMAPVFSNSLVHVETMREEIRRDQWTKHLRDEHLEQTDFWIRPWAVRATAGHSVSASTVMSLDPAKFALSASRSLLDQIGGAYHATEIYNLNAIVTDGLKTGSDLIELGRTSGRLHSYFGIFPP